MLPPFIHVASRYVGNMDHAFPVGAGVYSASQVFTANQAYYVPIVLPWPYPIRRFYWRNGTSVAGSIEVAIYGKDFCKICSSGAVTQAGTSAQQFVSAPYLLPPGSYYMAFAANNISGSAARWAPSSPMSWRILGMLIQSSAYPLPSPAVPAQPAANNSPAFGFTRLDSWY
jgi:hypothetical protein